MRGLPAIEREFGFSVVSESLPTSVSSPAPRVYAAADDVDWFVDEIHTHDAQLKAYLRGCFPSLRDVDDIAQESYLRIWRVRATRSIRSAKGFLFQVARHVATDLLRRGQACPVQTVAALEEIEIPDEQLEVAGDVCTREEIALLAEAIDALPSRCREIFILRKIQRVPQKEIARRLGISEQTVQGLVLRGMKRCEKFLARRGL